jgi:hypothetical protein
MNERGCCGTDRLEKSRRRKIAYFSLKTKIVLRQHKQMNHLIKLKYKKEKEIVRFCGKLYEFFAFSIQVTHIYVGRKNFPRKTQSKVRLKLNYLLN